ncbi:MAG: nucleotidyltransferase family protein [Chloroflexi bacterium]|nr:nucleotidyltransferase family protein [Chloroflexota bacterium]
MKGRADRFTAVVLAGDRTPDDPVARAAGVSCKALVPVAGTPMVMRVLGALDLARDVGARMLCGPSRTAVDEHADLKALIESGAVQWMEPQATPSTSASTAMDSLSEPGPVLLTTADHALLTAPVIDYFCSEARAKGCDLVVALARYELVASAYPGVRRTALRLRDGGYCGCNLFAFLTPPARAAAAFWRRVEHQRKQPLRLITTLGWIAVFRYLTGQLSLGEGLARLSRRMGLSVEVVMLPFPEAALDVDTASDWTLVQTIAGERGR